MVNGRGNTAHATPAIPASTPTPCGINIRISDSASPSVPPMNSNGKIGPPSNPDSKRRAGKQNLDEHHQQ